MHHNQNFQHLNWLQTFRTLWHKVTTVHSCGLRIWMWLCRPEFISPNTDNFSHTYPGPLHRQWREADTSRTHFTSSSHNSIKGAKLTGVDAVKSHSYTLAISWFRNLCAYSDAWLNMQCKHLLVRRYQVSSNKSFDNESVTHWYLVSHFLSVSEITQEKMYLNSRRLQTCKRSSVYT